jgi:hypothetical protein
MMSLKKSVTTAICGLILTTALATAQVVVRIGPPPPRPVEVVPAPPRAHRDWVWTPGYHRWDGRRYVWVGGHYMRPPHPGAVWVAGDWRSESGGHVWHEGYWR